jgi:hypothetical protein
MFDDSYHVPDISRVSHSLQDSLQDLSMAFKPVCKQPKSYLVSNLMFETEDVCLKNASGRLFQGEVLCPVSDGLSEIHIYPCATAG